jgi:putative PIN family toxin of toxin-antitoxin system
VNVVPDTNFFISGLLWDGNPRRCIILAEKRKMKLCGTEETYREFCRVISYPKFSQKIKSIHFSLQRMALDYMRLVSFFSTDVVQKKPIVEADPDDDIFLEAAIASKARIIVSGDNHLLTLKIIMGIHILSCTELLKLYDLLEEKEKPPLNRFPKHPRLLVRGKPIRINYK